MPHQVIGLVRQIREVQHLERQVVERDLPASLGERQAVVVGVAPHPHETLGHPV